MMAAIIMTTPHMITKGAATSLLKSNIDQLKTLGSLTPPPIIRTKPATMTSNPIRSIQSPLRVIAIFVFSDIFAFDSIHSSIIQLVVAERHEPSDNKISTHKADHDACDNHYADNGQKQVEAEYLEELDELLADEVQDP